MDARRIVVAGVGAVGGVVAGRLAAQGHGVALVARGDRRDQLLGEGLCWSDKSGIIHRHHLPVGAIAEFDGPDVLIVATKSQALPALLPELARHIRRDTLVVPLINGMPWWYATRRPLSAIDPEGKLGTLLDRASIVGTVTYVNAQLRDGVAHATGLNKLELGAVDGGQNAGSDTIAALLGAAGFDIVQPSDIRASMWKKGALNYATNSLSVVTGSGLSQLFTDASTGPIVSALLDEIAQLAAAEGYSIPASADLFPIGIAAGPVETSMLQDFNAGRAIEIDALAHAFIELGGHYAKSMTAGRMIAQLAEYRVRQRDQAVSVGAMS